MDGVIIDSEPLHKKCEKEIFKYFGISVSDEEHNELTGKTDEDIWSRIGSQHNVVINVDEALKIKKSLYMDYLKKESNINPIPFVSQLIKRLYDNGFYLALASSSPYEQIDYILSRFEIKDYFYSVVSGDDVKEGKPDPEIFLIVIKLAGIDPAYCIAIEDSNNGLTAAKNANIKCIGFNNPNSGNQDLSKADLIISSFKELSVDLIRNILIN
jgi:HAD superfamily hydrolase (TIGR01509 family)